VTSTAATKSIGLSAPFVDESEEEIVLEVIRSGQLAFGPMIERFEQSLAKRVEAPYVAAVSSGTAGLHLCVTVAPRTRSSTRAGFPSSSTSTSGR
jgi:dTDP-4-amino-4,6-dideoxygalactose transaminase